MPRANTSLSSRRRVNSVAACSRIASSRIRRNARRCASSSADRGIGVFLVLGQQQARFEIGEPRRHHEVIGCDLELQLLRFGDEGQILLDERQNRNLGEVDFLRARQRQQQIERALKAVDVDDEGFARRRHILEARRVPVRRCRFALSCGLDHQVRLDRVCRRPVADADRPTIH